MVFELNSFISIVTGLLFGSFIVTIPLFLIAFAAGVLREKLAKKYSFNWLLSASIVTYVLTLIVIKLLYFFPMLFSISEQTIGKIPSVLQPTTEEWFMYWFSVAVKLLSISLVISIIFIPFILLGSLLLQALNSYEKSKNFPMLVKLFIATYVTVFVFAALFLYVFYWVIIGLIGWLYFIW